MLTIEVLGPGCSNCVKVAEVTQRAIASLGLEARVEQITE